jgi:hypothetical protein
VKPALVVISGLIAPLVAVSATRVIREPTAAAILQLSGASLLVVMVLTHFAEALSVLPQMGWGRPNTPGHYVDLVSAVAGWVLVVAGISLRVIGTGRKRGDANGTRVRCRL